MRLRVTCCFAHTQLVQTPGHSSWANSANGCPKQTQHWPSRAVYYPLLNIASWSFQSFADPLCQWAACNQDLIGFLGMMVGRVASKWINIQSSHYSSTGSPQSATLWLHCLCWQLILFTHAMWLSHNQQVQELLCQQESHSLRLAIRNQFRIGLSDLLPADHFYVMLDPQGFPFSKF